MTYLASRQPYINNWPFCSFLCQKYLRFASTSTSCEAKDNYIEIDWIYDWIEWNKFHANTRLTIERRIFVLHINKENIGKCRENVRINAGTSRKEKNTKNLHFLQCIVGLFIVKGIMDTQQKWIYHQNQNDIIKCEQRNCDDEFSFSVGKPLILSLFPSLSNHLASSCSFFSPFVSSNLFSNTCYQVDSIFDKDVFTEDCNIKGESQI